MNFYEVMVKGGHCGSGNYKPLRFAIEAKTAFDAVAVAQTMPGVKHSAFPLLCRKIERDRYEELRAISAYSRYGGGK